MLQAKMAKKSLQAFMISPSIGRYMDDRHYGLPTYFVESPVFPPLLEA